MSAVDPIRVRDHFLAAAELPKAARRSYLDENCGSHTELRAAIERLLAAHDDPLSLVNPVTVDYAPDLGLKNTSTTNTFDDPEESGGVRIGRYKLVERIGEGGMGEVWSARQTEPVKRMVAVKLIKPGMDSKAVLARFEAERQALALMDHPNIARVLDAGTTSDGRPFFVMELVRGIPIAKYCDDRKLSTRRRLELFVPVCQAIQHAHQKGIIHRDIKPSNVLVAQYDDRAVPKVIDFGVAKATGQALTDMTLNTGFGNIVGTLEYMSPEQATFNNLDIDTRSDVYALGVLLYELLTGGPPFKKRDLEKGGILEILRVVKEVDPPRPSTRISTAVALPTVAANRSTNPARLKVLLRNELDWIAMKALEKDRSRRYQTANGMAADIERHLAGEEVMAVPPSIGYRLRKFIGKYRVAATAGILVVLSLFCGAIVATIGLVRADLARDSEAEQRLRAEEQAAIAEEKTRISIVAEKRANEEAARAWASAQAESAAVVKSQRLLGLTYLKDAAQLLDNGDIEMGLLRITHAMSIASQVPEIQDIARTQLVLHERSELACLKHFLKVPHSEKSIPIVFSPNRHMLFSVVDGKSARVWDMESGKPISPLLEYPEAIASAAFSPDGERILTGCNDGSLWWWNCGGDRPVLKKKRNRSSP